MKKTTSQNLSKRLTQYGALSVAIAGIAEANAQERIAYTPPVDISGTIGQFYELNLDNDANVDFRLLGFGVGSLSSYAGLFLYNASILVSNSMSSYTLPGIFNNSFLGSKSAFYYPFALNQDDLISASQNSWFSAYSSRGSMNFASCFGGMGGSNWCGVTDKYLGLRFKIGMNTHYGWVRMDVSGDAFSWTIKDYAYHLDPDTPILAGQTTTLGINDNYLSKIRVVALNKSIGIYDLPVATDYKLYNMAGQELMKGTTENKDYVIEATTMASGVYIVDLSDTKSNAVIRKKVVLQ